MRKKLLTLFFTSVLVCPLSMAVFAQEDPAKAKKRRRKKKSAVDGRVRTLRRRQDRAGYRTRKLSGPVGSQSRRLEERLQGTR